MNDDPNYYNDEISDPSGLRYRLEGDDVIQGVIDIIRGGLIIDKEGNHKYNEQYRLMNEEGVARVELFLRGGVNKINHLTKYKNEGRILQQMKSLIRGFTIELVLNLKTWAPDAKNIDGELVNPTINKVRNKHIVLLVVENALFQSMQRGGEGFEAELTGKSWMVQEQIGNRPQEYEQQRNGFMGGLFGRREQ